VGVKRLADYLKRKIESDAQLRNVSVRGEISNYSVPPSGHVHFDLKEGDVVLHCFAFGSGAANFPSLKHGVAVVATGAIVTYPQRSVYQLLVNHIVLEGVGDLHALFEQRKKKLAADGLFDAASKRPLPAFPFHVALVSSRSAAGALDFVTILRERAPHVRVVWCETAVQGAAAPAEICAALRRASAADVDLIVVTRGGGSFEDLFAFSDESVVRAVARARHPVLSAIGHTHDQQLSDFAADVYVETPSAAAKRIGFETRELLERTREATGRAQAAAGRGFERLRFRLSNALVRSKLADPRSFLAPLAQRSDEAETKLRGAMAHGLTLRTEHLRDIERRLEAYDPTRRLAERGARLQGASLKLDAAVHRVREAAGRRADDAALRLGPAARRSQEQLGRRLELAFVRLEGNSPERLLQRGYAIVTHRGAIVRDPRAVPAGDAIEARVARGTLSARVERIEVDGDQRIG
jgi:exodeoxyribonuclease VII large subunit